MDIGKEQEIVRVEPLEDPFRKDRPQEPARPVPRPAPKEEPLPA